MPGRTAGVVGGIDRRDVIEGIDEVDDVFIAAGEVPAHAALLDHDAERVGPAGQRPGLPSHESHHTSPCEAAVRPCSSGLKRSALASACGTRAARATGSVVPRYSRSCRCRR